MHVSPDLFLHPLDQGALKTLQAIPGFTPLLKAFLKLWSEKQFHIQNMATHLRIDENQLPELYALLPPICARLGIEVPALYLKMDGTPNAYTSGDTKPFIVITSGLVEKFPRQLLPAVLAHECGHIACHHVLYHTMGDILLSTAAMALGIGDLVTLPIQTAFAYWMRCSELSADRAAALCTDGADDVVEYCMRFAGYPSNIPVQGNREAFLHQAADYLALMEQSNWNKVLETLMFAQEDHPLNAVRAYECHQWVQAASFAHLQRYARAADRDTLVAQGGSLPLPHGEKHYLGRNAFALQEELQKAGFTNVVLQRVTEPEGHTKPGQTLSVRLGAAGEALAAGWHGADDAITLRYYQPLSDAEIIAQHPGQVRMPDASRTFAGMDYQQAAVNLRAAGFTNIQTVPQHDSSRGWFTRDREVIRISIGGKEWFEKGAWFDPADEVRILYRVLPDQG